MLLISFINCSLIICSLLLLKIFIILLLQGLRAQIDRSLYKKHIQSAIMTIPNLKIVESPVEDLVLKPVEQPTNDVSKQQCQGVMFGVHIPYFTLLVHVIIIKFWNIISYHPLHTCITLDYVSGNTSVTPVIHVLPSTTSQVIKV